MFTELRGLGLINEQIDWKQRFFVPTDDETGIAVVASLLARYPIIPAEVLGESDNTSIERHELSRPPIVNLDERFVCVAETALTSSRAPDEINNIEEASSLSTLYFARATVPVEGNTQTQLALDFG